MMEFEIVIRHLEVRYVDLENMSNERKRCGAFWRLPQRHKGDSPMFLKKRSILSELQFGLNRV